MEGPNSEIGSDSWSWVRKLKWYLHEESLLHCPGDCWRGRSCPLMQPVGGFGGLFFIKLVLFFIIFSACSGLRIWVAFRSLILILKLIWYRRTLEGLALVEL